MFKSKFTLLISMLVSTLFFPDFTKADQIDEFDIPTETDKSFFKNEKKKNNSQKFAAYLIKLKDMQVIDNDALSALLEEVREGKLFNPLNCQNIRNFDCSKNSSSQAQVHSPELEKYTSAPDSLDFYQLENILRDYLKNEKIAEENKEKSKKEETSVEKIKFYTIPAGEKYYDLGRTEKAGVEDLSKIVLYNEIKSLYKFAEFRINKKFDLADTLVTQSFFARIMGFNPTYGLEAESFLKNDRHIETIDVKGKKIKVKRNYPVGRVDERTARDFLNSINNKRLQRKDTELKALSKNGRCKFDFLLENEFDYVKFQWIKYTHFIKELNPDQTPTHDSFDKIHLTSHYIYINEFNSYSNSNENFFLKQIDNHEIIDFFFKNKIVKITFHSDNNFNKIDLIYYLKFGFFEDYNFELKNENIPEKDVFVSPRNFAGRKFFGLVGNKKIFVRRESPRNQFITAGISFNQQSKEHIVLDTMKTIFDKNAFMDSKKNIHFEIKEKEHGNSLAFFDNIKYLLLNETHNEILDASAPFKAMREQDLKDKKEFTDNPFGQGILLVRRCE